MAESERKKEAYVSFNTVYIDMVLTVFGYSKKGHNKHFYGKSQMTQMSRA